jgi:hypothetical protein
MASIEIDVDDVIWALSVYEKQELVDELYNDGFVAKQLGIVHPDDTPIDDFDKQVTKLIGNSWRLSRKDENTILNITNKLIL